MSLKCYCSLVGVGVALTLVVSVDKLLFNEVEEIIDFNIQPPETLAFTVYYQPSYHNMPPCREHPSI